MLLSIGTNNSQMNATWYATQATSGYVLVAKQSPQVDGAMPQTGDHAPLTQYLAALAASAILLGGAVLVCKRRPG